MVEPEDHTDGSDGLRHLFGIHRAHVRHRRGDYLFTPEQPAHTLFLIVQGAVRLQLVSAEGRTLTIRVIEPGQICGHAMLSGNERYDTFAEAVTQVDSLTLRPTELRRALAARPELQLTLIDELGRHYQAISQRLDEVAFKSVPSRLASLLVAMAREAHAAPTIRLPRRTHQQMADMINAQRETVTKTINEFRALRLLEIDRTEITLLNLERLRELAAR
jgi:CRP-like cAMP-binding protein